MKLSKNSNPKTKTTGYNPRREAHQISLAPPRNQVPARRSVEAASIPPGKFRQPGNARKTAFVRYISNNTLIYINKKSYP
jgi:hypothetical protein